MLWAWFVVTTFSVPALSIPAAIGLFLTVAMFKNADKKNAADIERPAGETLIIGALAPLFLLGMGWIVKQFMN